MRVLVIGSGAREHAIAWKFSQSRRIAGLFALPGNAGTQEIAVNIGGISTDDFDGILDACRKNRINTVFVGPETPLAKGIADFLENAGIPVIGPKKRAAMLESSKAYAKDFLHRHGIPTALSVEFDDPEEFKGYIEENDGKEVFVIKKSGLAGGKGVLVTDSRREAIDFGLNILSDDRLIVEEYLEGFEVSIFVLSDGKHQSILPPCSDFKKAHDGDKGPNTGGMGSICPVPWVDTKLRKNITDRIVKPVFRALEEEGITYTGILYFGLMITEDGPKVLEFNVRLGDPETQVLLPLIENDIGNLSDAIINGNLDTITVKVKDSSALGVVVAADGYPGSYRKGIEVESLPRCPRTGGEEVLVFHSSTVRDESGRILTGGGRCFTVVGLGRDTITAAATAYQAVEEVKFQGAWYRRDIGKKFFVD